VGRYSVRLYAHANGISLFLPRDAPADGGSPASTHGGG
jgi:hypothetical protein